MAISKKNTAAKPAYEQADAWLNLSVIDANGNSYKLPKGLALYLKDKLPAQMIKAASAKEVVFKLEGVITIPNSDNGELENIDF